MKPHSSKVVKQIWDNILINVSEIDPESTDIYTTLLGNEVHLSLRRERLVKNITDILTLKISTPYGEVFGFWRKETPYFYRLLPDIGTIVSNMDLQKWEFVTETYLLAGEPDESVDKIDEILISLYFSM